MPSGGVLLPDRKQPPQLLRTVPELCHTLPVLVAPASRPLASPTPTCTFTERMFIQDCVCTMVAHELQRYIQLLLGRCSEAVAAVCCILVPPRPPRCMASRWASD